MVAVNAEQYGAIVVGGGPAGSTAAALIAKQGHRVLLLEKETFPRYQIGESLLPSTVHGIGRLLGITEELEKAGFVRKHGGTFRWGSNPEPWTFAFSLSPRMAGPTSFAYQVERMKFDKILLDNARRLGADVRENSTVNEVLSDDERVVGVRWTDADGNAREAHATFVIDASGNKTRISDNAGGRRVYSEFFRNLALFGYFEGGKRLPEPRSGNILSAAFDSGWFWYIPLSNTLTSVGAVVRRDMAAKVQGDPEKALRALIAECPLIADCLSEATRVTEGPYGEIRVRKDYSYCNTAFWRPGMVLVGDAACFVDPVFSSGVHLATFSGMLAARSINTVLAGKLEEERCFAEFEARYRAEYAVFYEFLLSFYEMNVSEDSYFWQAKKVTNADSADLQAFVELVGGVSSGESSLTSVASVSERFRSTSAELSAAVDQVAESDSTTMKPLFDSGIVGNVMAEGARIQATAFLGADADERPTASGTGLIATDDGLHWTVPGSA